MCRPLLRFQLRQAPSAAGNLRRCFREVSRTVEPHSCVHVCDGGAGTTTRVNSNVPFIIYLILSKDNINISKIESVFYPRSSAVQLSLVLFNVVLVCCAMHLWSGCLIEVTAILTELLYVFVLSFLVNFMFLPVSGYLFKGAKIFTFHSLHVKTIFCLNCLSCRCNSEKWDHVNGHFDFIWIKHLCGPCWWSKWSFPCDVVCFPWEELRWRQGV